jgi:hypothetical protein
LPGLGGLPRLLRGLDAAFDFTAAEAGTWGRQKRAVWRLEGTWKRDRLAWMLPAQKAAMEAGKAPDLSKLPEHLPDRVVLYLGQDDMFPYRVEYHRRKADEDEDTPARPLVVMELYDVALNVPISRSHFTYSPGNAEFTDQTEAYIKALGGK